MSVRQPGSSRRALARGTRFYLWRILRRPYPYVVFGYALIVPSALVMLGRVDDTIGWTKILIATFPVVYVALVVAAGLGGMIGFDDGAGLRAGLPVLGLSVRRQYRAAAAALAFASVAVIGGGLVAGGLILRAFLDSPATGTLVAGLTDGDGFAVIVLGLVLLVYTYALVEFVAGRLFDLPGRTIGWLQGINIMSAFAPVGIDLFGPRLGSPVNHLVLWAICTALLSSAFLIGRRLES